MGCMYRDVMEQEGCTGWETVTSPSAVWYRCIPQCGQISTTVHQVGFGWGVGGPPYTFLRVATQKKSSGTYSDGFHGLSGLTTLGRAKNRVCHHC